MSALAPDDPRHGTYTAYNYHRCRCDPCRSANAAYTARHRQTPSGSEAVKVTARAQTIAVNLVRNETPDLWADILDQAWIDITGHPARPIGRPRAS